MAYTTIDKPTDYFNTVLYTGNGSTQTISGVGFQPDWTWIKCRSDADNHSLQDSVRGANKHLRSDATTAETTSGTVHISSWNSDGFALGSGDGQTNASSRTYASWNWKAGTAFSNDAGANGASLASSGSKNDTAGFSIVSYTGDESGNDTIFHGLSQTPDVIIAKSRASADNWGFFHSSFSSQEYMFLNSTSAKASASSDWNALPSSTVFTVGDNAAVNDNGAMIAYCFHSVKGYSKFGSYTGNGSTDGTYIHLGFKAAYIMIKGTGSGTNWFIQDNKRNPHNIVNKYFNADSNAADQSADMFDITANGIKQRNTFANLNGSGSTYIFMAFAENPFVSSGGIPTTAR